MNKLTYLVKHCDSHLDSGSTGLLEMKRISDNDPEFVALTGRIKSMGLWD
jgi:hypothetical protein